MAKKGTKFQSYTEEFKRLAIERYINGDGSYQTLSKEFGLRSPTQLKTWVRKFEEGNQLTDQRGKPSTDNPLKGRPKTKFKNVEEERDYYKAQVDYLKKQYPNLHGEGKIRKSIRFEIIHELKGAYPITWLTEIAEVQRSGYYKWVKTIEVREKKKELDQGLMNQMLSIHLKHKEYGYPRMVIALKEEGFEVNHKKVYRLMKVMDIQSVIRKKWRYHGKKGSKVFPNLVNREFKERKENEVLVTDITYIPFQNRFYYLSVIQDIYNNEIVAWKLSDRNNMKLVLDTVEELNKKRNVHGTILHSDQGFQYTSKKYNKRLNKYGIKGSHSRKGNCLDNACVESFFSHFKTEMLYQTDCKTEEELIQAIETFMYEYNYKRFQKRLNHRAPVEYRITMAA